MQATVIGISRDTHCTDCRVDSVETVVYDEGSVIFVALECCGEEIEYLASDWLDLISEG